MKHITISAAAFLLVLAGPVLGQATTQEQMPNGNVRTTTRVETPGGTAATRTVDRPDGSRTVTRRTTDTMGNSHIVHHDSRDGPGTRRVCSKRWHDGHRVTRCWRRHG